MKNFNLLSFGLGLGSGLLVLVIVFGGMRVMTGGNRARFGGPNGGNFQQFQGGNGGPNRAAMAERFGMTEAELQAELDSGKTMQEIALEHGVDFTMGGRGMRQGGGAAQSSASGTTATGTGNAINESSSVSQ